MSRQRYGGTIISKGAEVVQQATPPPVAEPTPQQELTRQAYYLAQRAAAGKPITFYYKGGVSEALRQEYLQIQRESPAIKEAIRYGTAARQERQVAEGKIPLTPERIREFGVAQTEGEVILPEKMAVGDLPPETVDTPEKVQALAAAEAAARAEQVKEQEPFFKIMTPEERKESFEKIEELPWISRGKSGGVSVPGTVARLFTKSQLLFQPLEKVPGIRKLGALGIPRGKTEQIISEAALFTFFSPAFTTTTQIEKKLTEATGVQFKGIQQTQKGGRVQTDIKFITSKGEKGLARGRTIAEQLDDVTYARTQAKGITFKRGIKFPSGKEVIKKDKTFFGETLANLKSSNNLIKEFARGDVVVKKSGKTFKDTFISIAYGKRTGDVIDIAGKTLAKKGGFVLERGALKISPTTSQDVIFTIGGRGGGTATSYGGTQALSSISKLSSQQLAQISGTKATQHIVSAALTLPKIATPSFVTSVTPLVKTITEQRTKITPKLTTIPKITAAPKLKTKPDTLTIVKQKSSPIQKLKLGSGLIFAQAPSTTTTLAQITPQTLAQPTTTQQTTTTFSSFSFPNPKPKTPKLPFFFPLKLGRTKTIKTKGTFRTEVKRGGKFKQIGSGLSFGSAFQIGSARVSKTLAATFRIRGPSAKVPAGFILPKTIRRKKKKRLTFVEKKGARLSSPGEIKQITKSRKMKGGRKK